MPDPLPTALPPHPNPRRPSWSPPAGATDTHFHVFGPPSRFPYAPTRRYEPPAAPFEHWESMAQVCGIERGVVVQPTAHGTDPSAILDAVTRADGRLRAVTAIDEQVSDDLLDELAGRGVVGARFSLMHDRSGAVADIERAVDRLAARGWSLDLHVEPAALLDNEQLLRELPVPVVIDHLARIRPSGGLGQPALALLLDLLREPHVWVKVSCADKISDVPVARPADGSLPFLDVVPLARAAIEVAPERVLWGTDWPHGNTFERRRVPDDGDLVDLLAEFAPDESQRRRILVDNPARLYGFPSR